MFTPLLSLGALVKFSVFCSPLWILSPAWRTIDPSDFNEAISVEAPISEVTVYKGHATIERKAQLKVGADSTLIRLPDLPHNAQELKISATKTEVLRVIQARRVRQSLDLNSLEEHVIAIEALSKEINELATRFEAPKAELSLIKKLSTPQFRSEQRDRVVLNKKAQTTRQNYRLELESRQVKAQAKLESIRQKIEEKLEKYQSHWSASRQISVSSRPRNVLEVFALLASKNNTVSTLKISYRVPNANWSPVYELHVDASRGSLKRRFGVRVSQNSGEDWSDVRLRVSTGDEQLILSRPQLNTWLLSERQQFRPQLTAARRATPRPLFQSPVYRREQEESIQKRAQMLQRRLDLSQQSVRDVSNTIANQTSSLESIFSSDSGIQVTVGAAPEPSSSLSVGGRGEGRYSQRSSAPSRAHKRRRSAPPSPPPMAPRPTSRIAESAAIEPKMESIASMPDDSPMSLAGGLTHSSTGLSLADQTQYVIEEEAYRYQYTAPNQATILNGAAGLLVPMEVKEQRVELIYETTPALSPHAYLTGQATHEGELPIQAGAASLFSSGSFVGESQLKMTLQGEQMTLYLGADSDVKVKRHLEVQTETSGVFSKTDTSTYTVNLQVANYKRRSIKVKLYDVLPISDDDEVKVKLVSSKPSAQIDDEKSGVVSWLLNLKAGEKSDVTLRYQISHPAKKRVYQR